MVDLHDDPATLSSLLAEARRPCQEHHRHPEIYQLVFDRFQHLEISEPFPDIARIIKVPLKTIYR
jgi:hypothetical protein